MKRFIQNFTLLVVSLSLFACGKGFLEVNTQKEVTKQGYVKDLITLEHYYNGIYILLNKDFEKGIGAAYPEIVADNLKPNISSGEALIAHYTWTQKADPNVTDAVMEAGSVCSDGLWSSSGYGIIRSCNFFLEEVDKYRQQNPDKADRMKGEMLAIRAMIHFKLVSVFAQPYNFSNNGTHAGIPYITTSDITEKYSRETVKDVYQKIIEDFTEAEKLLPESIPDIRKMNKAAVKGLLARTYLFKEDYQNAKLLSQDLLQKYPLLSVADGYPDAVFMNRPIHQTETLFQLTPLNLASPNITVFLNFYMQPETVVLFCATNDIAEILQEDPLDARSKWVSYSGNNFIVKKFPKSVANEIPAIDYPETSYYPSVIRSSELALIAAESSAKLNEQDLARSFLNSVRQRANSNLPPVTESGPALLDSIYKERRKELSFEGLRLFDLQRWKAGIHRKDVVPEYSQAKDLDFPNEKAVAPIPYKEITLAGLSPNPGY